MKHPTDLARPTQAHDGGDRQRATAWRQWPEPHLPTIASTRRATALSASPATYDAKRSTAVGTAQKATMAA
jgi:hypothetical protein